jgi:hypothetical protein
VFGAVIDLGYHVYPGVTARRGVTATTALVSGARSVMWMTSYAARESRLSMPPNSSIGSSAVTFICPGNSPPEETSRRSAELAASGHVPAAVPVEVADAAGVAVISTVVEGFVARGRLADEHAGQ